MHQTLINAGAVLYLDTPTLMADPAIDHDAVEVFRPGPFLCVETMQRRATLIPLTGRYRKERLEIKLSWRIGGTTAFRSDPLFVADGLGTFLGPIDAFAEAGHQQHAFWNCKRPRVTRLGVEVVLGEIEAQGGPLLAHHFDTRACA